MSDTEKKQGAGCWKILLVPIIIALIGGGSIIKYCDFFGLSLCNKPKTVIGYVKESGTRNPLLNALVEITSDSVGRMVRTDGEGRFEFKEIEPVDHVEIKITIGSQDSIFKRQINFCGTKMQIELKEFVIEPPKQRQTTKKLSNSKDTSVTMPSPVQTLVADSTCRNNTNPIDKVGDLTGKLNCCRKVPGNMVLCNLSLKSDVNGVFQVCANDGWTAKILDDSGKIYPATSIIWEGEEKKRCVEINYFQKMEVSLNLKFHNVNTIGKVVRLEVPTTYGTLVFD